MSTYIKVLLVIVATLALAGCSSHKKTSPADNTVRKITKMIAGNEVNALAGTYSEWDTFYAPFSLNVSRPVSFSVSGRATMVRGDYIFLSLRMLGFEIASVYVTADSAFVADKYHKMYVAEPISAVTANTGLTIGDIQEILLGRGFFPGQGSLCSIKSPDKLFAPVTEDNVTMLIPRRTTDNASWWLTIDDTPALRRITVEPNGREPLLIDFSETIDGPAGAVAAVLMVLGEISGKDLEAMVQWNLGKSKWNEPVNPPSLSFKGYRRLNMTELMQILKNQ